MTSATGACPETLSPSASPRPAYPFDAAPPGRPFSVLNRQRIPSGRCWPYRVATFIGRILLWLGARGQVIRRHAPERPGPYILALTHLSHLDPFLCCLVVRRKVDFIASVGFFRFRWAAWFMQAMQSIAIKRSGVPVSAFRKAIAHLGHGRVVGICPEGGVAQGTNSAMRGAPIKRGVCLLAQRAGVPILPAVMLGTDKMNCVAAWLPLWQTRLYVNFGEPIFPPGPEVDRRTARRLIAEQVEQSYRDLFRELLCECNLKESFVP